jgi:hypothetical protein
MRKPQQPLLHLPQWDVEVALQLRDQFARCHDQCPAWYLRTLRSHHDPYEAFIAKMTATGGATFSLTWPSATGSTYNILIGTNQQDARFFRIELFT